MEREKVKINDERENEKTKILKDTEVPSGRARLGREGSSCSTTDGREDGAWLRTESANGGGRSSGTQEPCVPARLSISPWRCHIL